MDAIDSEFTVNEGSFAYIQCMWTPFTYTLYMNAVYNEFTVKGGGHPAHRKRSEKGRENHRKTEGPPPRGRPRALFVNSFAALALRFRFAFESLRFRTASLRIASLRIASLR